MYKSKRAIFLLFLFIVFFHSYIIEILNNKDITITDNKMTRFIMSLDNAVELLCSALSYGRSGEIFVQKTFSTKLITIAESLLEIFENFGRQLLGLSHSLLLQYLSHLMTHLTKLLRTIADSWHCWLHTCTYSQSNLL